MNISKELEVDEVTRRIIISKPFLDNKDNVA